MSDPSAVSDVSRQSHFFKSNVDGTSCVDCGQSIGVHPSGLADMIRQCGGQVRVKGGMVSLCFQDGVECIKYVPMEVVSQ